MKSDTNQKWTEKISAHFFQLYGTWQICSKNTQNIHEMFKSKHDSCHTMLQWSRKMMPSHKTQNIITKL